MTKWLIPYSFLVFCICIQATGFSAPAQKIPAAPAIKYDHSAIFNDLSYEEADIITPVGQADSHTDILFPCDGLRIFHSAESFFIHLPNYFITTSRRASQESAGKKEIGGLVKDHLFHIFPSHYFW